MGKPHDQGRTAVYRIFNTEGGLLYIGSSQDPAHRVRVHTNQRLWGDEIASYTAGWHRTRKRAYAVEAAAIRAEHPLYNIRHTPLQDRLDQLWTRNAAPLTVDEAEAILRAYLPCDWWIDRPPRGASAEVYAEAKARVRRWLEAKGRPSDIVPG